MRLTAVKVALLAVAVSLVVGCDKPTLQNPANESANAKVQANTTSPFSRQGELLSVDVKDMERRQFLMELQKLTGSRMELRAGAEGKVTVKAENASLRSVLASAFSDAPYAINMQFNSVQDPFPAQVLITPHGAPAPMVRTPSSLAQELAKSQGKNVEVVESSEEEIDFDELKTAEEKLAYFFKQDVETQSSIVFDLDADEDQDLLHALFTNEQTGRGIKVEILDNFSFGEYDSAIKTITEGLNSDEPIVVAKALTVLGELGSESDLETVKQFTSSEYPASVREAAQEAVEFLEP